MSKNKVEIKLTGDNKNLSGKLKRSKKDLKEFGDQGQKSGRDASRGMKKTESSVSSLIPKIAVLATVTAGVAKAFNIQRETDIMQSGLQTITQDAKQTGLVFDELNRFAAETPYTLEQSVEGFTKLVNLGLTPSKAALLSYGNTAAAMGKDLSQMVEAVADAATGEFERLKEFGIKAKNNGDTVAFTFQGTTTTIRNSSEEIEKYLMNIGENQFASSMSNRMNTLDGDVSNLAQTFGNTFRIINESSANSIFRESVQTTTDALYELNAMLESGQMGAYIDGFAASFGGFARDAEMAISYITDLFDETAGEWVEDVTDALEQLPQNVRAFLQIMTVESVSSMQIMAVRAESFVAKIKALFTDDTVEGVRQREQAQIDAINLARQASIVAIMDERDVDVAATQEQINIAEKLRKKYEEQRSVKAAASKGLLGSYKVEAEQTKELTAAQKKLSGWYQNYINNITPATAATAKFNATQAKLQSLLNSKNPSIFISLKQYKIAILAAAKERDKVLNADKQKLADWYKDYINSVEPAAAAQSEFNATLEKLNKLLNEQNPEFKINQADYDKALTAAKAKRDKAIAESKKKAKTELTEMQSLYWETTKRIDEVMANSWKNMDQGFEGVVDGMKKAFKNMLAEMAHTALTRPITLQLQNSIATAGTATAANSAASTVGGAAAFNPITAAIAVGGLVIMNQLEKMQKADDERMKRFTAEYRQKHQNTGTVLGDIYAQSHSVSELTEHLGKIGTDALSVNRDMYLSLLRIEQGIARVTNGVARTLTRKGGLESFNETKSTNALVDAHAKFFTGSYMTDALGLGNTDFGRALNQFSGWVSKGIYNKSTSLQDAGLSIHNQRLQDILNSGKLSASQYQQVKTTKSYGWGLYKSSSSHSEYSKLDESIKYQLGAVFKNANDVFQQFNKELGLGLQSTISNLKIDGSKLSLKGLKGEALSKALESYLSNTLDKWSDSFLKAGGLDRLTIKYQKAGEGQFQTLGRLVAQSRAWQQVTNKLGLQFNATKVQALEYTQQLAAQAGGFEKLQGLTAAYYDKFYSQDEKQAALKRQLTKIFGELSAPLPNTREQFRKMIESLNLTTQAGQKKYAQYMKLVPTLDQYLTGLKEQNNALDALGGTLAKNSGAWLTHFKKLDEWGKKEHQRIRGEYQERIRLAGETERLVKTLGGWLTEIKLGDLSTSTPAQKLALAKSEYEQTLAKAQGGDNTVASALKDMAQRYLKVADGFYGRNAQYQAIYNDILAKVGGVKNSLASGQSVENLTREMNNKMQAVKDHIAQQLKLAGQQAKTQKNQLEVLKALPKSLADSLAKILGTSIQRGAASAPVMHGSHAKGLDRVPFDGYRAELHKGEMVLPAGMAQLLRNPPSANNKELVDEIRQLRAELAELKAEQARANNKAEQQRGHNIDATEQVVRHTRQHTQVSV